MLRFQNPQNNHIEEVKHPGWGALLLGPIYFLLKGIWIHALIGAVLFYYSWGLSTIVYAFFAGKIVETHYLRQGWIRLKPDFDNKEEINHI